MMILMTAEWFFGRRLLGGGGMVLFFLSWSIDGIVDALSATSMHRRCAVAMCCGDGSCDMSKVLESHGEEDGGLGPIPAVRSGRR